MLLVATSAQVLINSVVSPPEEPAPSAARIHKLQGCLQNAQNVSYKYGFAAQEWIQYPGGLYKASSTANFPASDKLSGALFKLNPGGLREMHWHNPNEWGFVLNGTCRATLVNQGSTHMVESWDFDNGDIWFFPGNFGHVILGVDPEFGCTYMTSYDQGDFDERLDAQGLSGWYIQAPAAVAAQVTPCTAQPTMQFAASEFDTPTVSDACLVFTMVTTSASEAAAALFPFAWLGLYLGLLIAYAAFGLPNTSMITANLVNGTNNFLPQGNLTELIAGDSTPSPVLAATSAPLTSQVNAMTHRYAFGTAGYLEVSTDGGTVRTADSQYFPASTAMSGSLVHFKPGALRQMHWHVNEDEWQFVINGTIETQLYSGLGALSGVNTLGPNDLGVAPAGLGHFLKNADPENDAWMILVFNNGSFTNLEIEDWIGNFPLSYTALSLNTSLDFVQQFNFSRSGLVAQGPAAKPDTIYTI
ncbi:MAG: oxalate decarboxylase [Trebouxia sp. A1-2]|nr:MAG: oxalate decarboxylase [Trebouxia sp. A1-2]